MSKKKDKRNREPPRDLSTIANDPLRGLLRPVQPIRPVVITRPLDLRVIEDRRTFHPDPIRPALNVRSQVHRLVAPKVGARSARKSPSRKSSFSYSKPQAIFNRKAVMFQEPKKVLVCVRRKQRAEVLHATKRTGKGGQRKPRYNRFSDVRCR